MTQRPNRKCINLREQFGQQYRITHDEAYEAERSEFRAAEEVWLQQIPCRRGHICPWGGGLLAACTNGRGPTARKLLALPFLEHDRTQDGSDGVNVVFHVQHFATVAEIMRPKQRRRLSPEARARLAAAGAATRFMPGKHGTRAAGDELERVQEGQLDLGAIPI